MYINILLPYKENFKNKHRSYVTVLTTLSIVFIKKRLKFLANL